MIKWELKNKKTGMLYWMDDKEMEDLKKLGIQGRYIINEIKPLSMIRDPLQIEIKKSIKNKKSD